MSEFFIVVGLVSFVVAVVALMRGRLGWARIASRRVGAGATGFGPTEINET